MKQPTSKNPRARFDIPPIPPTAVAEAAKRFSDVADKWAGAAGEAEDATAAIEVARALDIKEASDAYVAGREVADPNAHEKEAQQRADVIQAALPSLSVAVDQAGNDLVFAIDEHREEWIAKVEAEEKRTAARFDAAIAEARAVLAELTPLRGAIEWLENFDVREAQMAYQPQFSGGRAFVKVRSGVLRGDHKVDELLRLAATLTEQVPVEVGS